MSECQVLYERIQARFSREGSNCAIQQGEVTLELSADQLLTTARALRDEAPFQFEMLMDICGVDYLHYGTSEWSTETASKTGFSRGVSPNIEGGCQPSAVGSRFAVVYHLLSLSHNQRLRLKTHPIGDPLVVPSVIEVWNSANWYEREAFDLFGILFEGHPDLRRILTDYGFVGHPFRKDFPLAGHTEMHYSAKAGRVMYQPVDLTPRVLVPKVVRDDHRYSGMESNE